MARKNILTGSKKRKAAALVQARRFQEARDLYEQVCKTDPVDADAWLMLGAVHGLLGNPADAAVCCHRAASLEPGNPQAHYNLATALKDLGRLEEAASAYREALRCKPDYADAWDALGYALMSLGRHNEAVAAYREVLRYAPKSAKAHANLGASLHTAGHLEEAVEAYREALRLDHLNAGIQDSLGCALSDQGRLEEAMQNHRKALAMAPGYSTAHSNLLMTMHYLPGPDPDRIFEEHKSWARIHTGTIRRSTQYENSRDVNRCLKVGYVSSDFRAHSVAFFIEPILARHDRGKIESICYSGVTNPDATTRRLRQLAGRWRDIGTLTDEQVVEAIRQDGVDILVDLAGHTPGNRLKVFARKPAPIQVTYLGYPDTTGLEAMDYRLTDAQTDPPGAEKYYTEKLVRLPDGFLCYQPLDDCPPVSPLPSQERGHVTFGSFNNLSKINSNVIELWAGLLQSVPGARLLIKSPSLTDATTRERYYGLFERQGIGRDRVALQGRTATQAEHLALYSRLDIALDTFPYNGTTTTCEALWMGVPVITLTGRTHAGRVGRSLLSTVGLSELIAESPEGYVSRAATLAANKSRLSELRTGMREHVRSSLLCNSRTFTHNLEVAYRTMWHQWCSRFS